MKEAYYRFLEARAEVAAISADSLESHRSFAEKLGGLPFPLLSDTSLETIKAYGVVNDRGTGARRSVFVVAPDGVVAYANQRYEVSKPEHLEAIFEALSSVKR